MLKFEENIVLDDIAKKVVDLVSGKTQEIDGKSALKRFREMVEEYGRRNDSYKKKESEYCDERCKNVQKLRDNKRLQDKNAGPPDKSYTWEENLGILNEETKKIELLSGWMPTSTIQVPEDPEIWGNYGEHKDISSLIPEILLLNQYFLLAVCHDCFMGVELRPLIITKEMADKYEDGLGLYYTGHGNTNYVRLILEGKYEKFLESAYDDILHDLENRQNKTSAETGKGKAEQDKGNNEQQLRNANDAITDRQRYILQALHNNKAFDREYLMTTADIAKEAEGPEANPENFKEPMSDLSYQGLIETKTGRSGGVWLTEEGIKLTEHIISKR